MKIRLLKSYQIDGAKYVADSVLDIQNDDEFCNDLIEKGVAELVHDKSSAADGDDSARSGKTSNSSDKSKSRTVASNSADDDDDADLSDEALARIEKLVDKRVKAELAEMAKNVRHRPQIRLEEVDEPNASYKNWDEFITDVCLSYSSQHGGRGFAPTKRLARWAKQSGMGEQFVTKAVGSDEYRVISNPAGGFLVPTAFQAELLQVTPEMDIVGSRTSKVRMQSPTLEYPRRVDKTHTTSVSGGLTLAWKEETAEITASQQTFSRLKLEAHELCGAAHVSQKVLRDSPISVVDIITNGFRQQYVAKLTNARIRGTGVGQPLGVLNSAALISVDKETGQPTASIVAENIIKMRARCWNYGNAIWLVNHDTLPQLMTMAIAVGTGGQLVWQQSLIPDQPSTLLGRPVFATEFCETLGTVGDILLCDWGEYIDGIRRDIVASTSMHVRFLNNEETMKVEMEFDGQPLWETVLTPQESSSTLSPFVALATRS